MAELGTVPPQTRRSLRAATSCSLRGTGARREAPSGRNRPRTAPTCGRGGPSYPATAAATGQPRPRSAAPPRRNAPSPSAGERLRHDGLWGEESSPSFPRARDLGCTEAWGWLQGKGRAAQERAEQTLRQKRYSFISNKSRPCTVGSPLGCKSSNILCLPHSPSPLGEHYGIIPVLFPLFNPWCE